MISEVHLENLSSLKHLNLGFSSLSLIMRSGWHPPFQLETISLSSINVGPEFPFWLTTQNRFNTLELSHTSLRGELPPSFLNFSLSDSPSRSDFYFRIRIDLSFNQLHGNIPNILKPKDLILSLLLNNNNFEGTLPRVPPNTIWIDLSHNSLSGELPQSFFNFSLSYSPSLSDFYFGIEIDLSFNQLHGNIPDILKPKDLILRLLLNNNNFKGTLPRIPPNTPLIDVSHNFLSGSITLTPGESVLPDFCCVFIFSHNSLSGTIPHSFCKFKGLEILDLSVNKFTGGFPNCLCGLPSLHTLDISSNELVGDVPDSIGKMYSLQHLHLSNNKFNGQIPSSMKNCTKLEILDLGKNKFSGSIPLWIGEHLQGLRVLSLHSNELNGSIPSQLCLLRDLKFLDLSQNTLSGAIPQCFPNFTYMVTGLPGLAAPPARNGERVRVFTKGKEAEYFNNFIYVTLLDLSSNSLVGEIPGSLTKLHGLEILNLSRNRLEGNIPGKIGDIRGLESLDLSQNKISGKIPPSMSNLYFLSYLNLSQNNLSGEIPSGYQLQTLDDPSIYMGNPQLCGAPLKKKCRPDEPSEDHGKVESLNTKGSEMNWFYIGLASGHAVGFGGFCVILFLNRKWRYAYYRILSSVTDWFVVMATVYLARMKRKLKVNQIRE